MIITLEGVDGSGKSTIFRELKKVFMQDDIIFVQHLKLRRELFPHITFIEEREIHLFEQLYDDDEVYLFDRFFAVTGPAYAKAFRRDWTYKIEQWTSETKVIYLHGPLLEIAKRLETRGDEHIDLQFLSLIDQGYRQVLAEYNFDSVMPLDTVRHDLADSVSLLYFYIKGLMHSWRGMR